MVETTKKHKIVLLGNASVGKTCIAHRFAKDTFLEGVEPTVGASFFTKPIRGSDGSIYQLDLWDTAGQERFKSLTQMYYKGAAGALVVYDVTNPSSFEAAKDWIKELHNNANPNIVIGLCGNKCDLNAAVSTDAGKMLAAQHSLLFSEVSAKSGQNINRTFEEMVSKLPKNPPKNTGQSINLEESNKSSSYCC